MSIKPVEKRLKARLAELRSTSALGKDSRKPVALDQASVGRLSRMDAMERQAMAKAAEGKRALEIRRIKAALERLEQGEYGWCEACGEAIAKGRLKVDPAAHLCLSCASGGGKG